MATQIFTNAHVITPNQNFLGSVVVENDLIVEVIKNKSANTRDVLKNISPDTDFILYDIFKKKIFSRFYRF